MVIAYELAAAGDFHEVVVAEIDGTNRSAQLFAHRPFDFDRRHRKEEWAGEIALGSDAGLRNRFLDRKLGKALGKSRRGKGFDRDEVDRSGHRGLEAFDRKARQ